LVGAVRLRAYCGLTAYVWLRHCPQSYRTAGGRHGCEWYATCFISRASDELEYKYKRSQIRAAWAQVGATGIAIAAVIVTIFVAWQGQVSVNHNSQASLQQSEDSQLSTAITALGSGNTAERVAGLLLLARNTSARFTLSPKAGEARANVFDDYTTALQIFSGYLSSHGETF
jgi:hypothetical protein